MKRSEEPTPYIFIPADTGSESDSCDFAIMHITDEWRRQMRRRLELIEQFKNEPDFYNLQYWDSPVGFYQKESAEIEDITEGILKAGEGWCFIVLDPEETDGFQETEGRLNCFLLTMTVDGCARYTATEKYTYDEYWTDDFNISLILTASAPIHQ